MAAIWFLAVPRVVADEPRNVSGIYPSLAMFNNENECGTGAVVPWADRLWVITYGPHLPFGSSDKLVEITPDLQQIVRPESVGGTPANRMIHAESQQLLIGPYLIDAQRQVRVIPPSRMPGRLTGNARHLNDPRNMVYYATMEEGLYEVDVNTLAVKNLIRDGNKINPNYKLETTLSDLQSKLPGYHGKGMTTAQGRVIYANNGDHDPRVTTDPTVPSGSLAEWRGSGDWQMVRRNQFTEVTGPGGIRGNQENDPAWSIGWDSKSLILMLLDKGEWQAFRLPKVSHSYDGAHGWNTEWPRIREIGQRDLLMTMHGAFWKFPVDFSASKTDGIRARSAYLKVVGDFCRWQDRLVFGCDDSAKSEFLNKRSVKGAIDSIGQSQSNLWFTPPELLDQLGPTHASGALWMHEAVKAGDKSDPFLVGGWKHGTVWHIDHVSGKTTREELDTDREWLQVTAKESSEDATVFITLTNGDNRSTQADSRFASIARADDKDCRTGVFRPRGENKRTLSLATDAGYYELDAQLKLKRVEDPAALAFVKSKVAIPRDVVTLDDASVLVVDDRGRRWRLPRATRELDALTRAGQLRVCREVATERDMLNVCGTFFELPAENADGFAKIRPVCSHRLRVTDFGGYRGMFIVSGINNQAKADEHTIISDDGAAALWAGAIDDLWKLGKPIGEGGPWKESQVKADEPSDPFLMWAYTDRSLSLAHNQSEAVEFKIELDLSGTGLWVTHSKVNVPAGSQAITMKFEPAVQARWLRVTANRSCVATAWLKYQ